MVRYIAIATLIVATMFSASGCESQEPGVQVDGKMKRDQIEYTPTEDERVAKLIVRLQTSVDVGKRRRAATSMARYHKEGKISPDSSAAALEGLEAALKTEEDEEVLAAIREAIGVLKD